MTDFRLAIDEAVAHAAPLLNVGSSRDINPIACLKAIAHVETNYGARGQATLHEPSYCYGGRYYSNSADLQRLSVPYGCLAHSSWGPWQILFIAAYEMGYRDDPVRLRDPVVSVEFVVKMINLRTLDKITDAGPEDVFDAWNSGTARDKFVPLDYLNKAMEHYRRLIA